MALSLWRRISILLLASALFLHLAAIEAKLDSLTVKVVDKDTGKPVERAHVTIYGQVNRTLTTGVDGKANFDGIPSGNYNLSVVHYFYVGASAGVYVEEETFYPVVLKRKIVTATLSAVEIPTGRLIPNATVTLTGPLDRIGGWEESFRNVTTGNYGSVDVELSAGTYKLSASAPNYRSLGDFEYHFSANQRISLFLAPENATILLDPLTTTTIGWLLAVINYYLGWTLVALPISHRGVKRWGWIMVEDGATYAFLIIIYGSIFSFVYFLWQLLYGVGTTSFDLYSSLLSFLTLNMLFAQTIIVFIFELMIVFGLLPIGQVLAGIVNPIVSALSWIAQVNAILLGFSFFILSSWPLFLSIGALLYGIPGRVGRYAGAGMMAFALVYFLGLPFMPIFVRAFAGDVGKTIGEIIKEMGAGLRPEAKVVYGFISWIMTPLATIYIYVLILPIIYMLILTAIAVGLARILGGELIFRSPIR